MRRIRNYFVDCLPSLIAVVLLTLIMIALPRFLYRRSDNRVDLYDQLHLSFYPRGFWPINTIGLHESLANYYEDLFAKQPFRTKVDWDALESVGFHPSSIVSDLPGYPSSDPIFIRKNVRIVWYIDDNCVLRVTSGECVSKRPREVRSYDARYWVLAYDPFYPDALNRLAHEVQDDIDASGLACTVRVESERLVIEAPSFLQDKAAWLLRGRRLRSPIGFMLYESEDFFTNHEK